MTRLWFAALADPLAVVVFGAILVQRLGVLRAQLRDEMRDGFENIVKAIDHQTTIINLRRYDDADRK
jgi:hypothetical protein